ncbi:MAG: formyltetrahydrofolate deformylase, partial [Oligoflexus sp.]
MSQFIYERGGNIIDSDQHTDHEAGIFATRLEWELEGFSVARQDVRQSFAPLLTELGMRWSLHFTDEKPRIAIWVSKQEHCLIDLLGRQRSGDIQGSIELIVSNHEELR